MAAQPRPGIEYLQQACPADYALRYTEMKQRDFLKRESDDYVHHNNYRDDGPRGRLLRVIATVSHPDTTRLAKVQTWHQIL